MKKGADTNYIIEFRQVGHYVRVSAMDPVTLTEVAIVGSPRTTESALAQLAVQKLEYVLRKKRGQE